MIKTINSKNWEKVNFGDVVLQIKDRVEREKTGLQYYLGGEHFDCGEIHIKQKGVIGSNPIGPAFHMRFKPGHMLIVSRNPHLRKASLVDFEGICANTTYVCEALKAKILPEFLPFLMQSDAFWYSAELNKRGSTNPYLNWGDFAKFGFKLPPLPEQKRLADLLWSVDDTEEKYLGMVNVLDKTFWSFFQSVMSGFRKVKLGEMLIPKKTQSIYPHKLEKYLGMEHIYSGDFTSGRFGNSEEAKANTFIFEKGDLLYGKLRPYLDKCVISEFSGVCSTEILVYDVKKKFSKELALFYMHSPKFVNYVSSRGYGTKMPRVSHEIIAEYEVSMPIGKEQEVILSKLKKLRKAGVDARENIVSCNMVKKQIINKIFG
jgi:type I restriction enzyme, S subunit